MFDHLATDIDTKVSLSYRQICWRIHKLYGTNKSTYSKKLLAACLGLHETYTSLLIAGHCLNASTTLLSEKEYNVNWLTENYAQNSNKVGERTKHKRSTPDI